MNSAADWDLYRLGDVLAFSNGINARRGSYGHGVPFINVSEVIAKESISLADIKGRVSLPRKASARYRVNRGDILFNRSSETQDEVGMASVYVDDDLVVFGGFVLRGQPKNALLNLAYSQYALRAPEIRRQLVARGQGGIRANIGQQDLKSVLIKIPSEREQALIAESLDCISNLITTLESLVEKKIAIKQGLLQELLTGRTRLSGFAGEWSTKKLATLGAFLRGRGIKRDEVRSSGVPCIRYGELYTAYGDYTSSTVSFVGASVAGNALPIRSGDILFAGSGETKEEIGMSVAYIGSVPAVAGGDIIVLRGIDYDPVYLASLLNTPEVTNQKARGGQGDAVVHINWRVIAGLQVTLPSLPEQRAIAAVLLDADAEIAAIERRLKSMRAIKQGMMQELLTGRIRLVPTEEEA